MLRMLKPVTRREARIFLRVQNNGEKCSPQISLKPMDTELFYAGLRVVDNFIGIADSKNFKSVPRDWYILITDIVGSTKAIEAGRYKDVNLLGACSIVAVLNIASKIEV